MIDASAGGALMNKTPEEAWELIESVADNNQYFKTRATSTAKGVYEITPSESTVLVKSLTDIASMLRELKESQQATPKILSQQPQNSLQIPIRHCVSRMARQSTRPLESQPTTSIPPTLQQQSPINSQGPRYQPPHNRQPYPSNSNFPPSYEDTLRAFQQENKEMREAQKRTEAQITNLTEMLTKFTIQVITNPSTSSPPPNPSPLPSQPLPNLKGGINMVQKGEEEESKKARTEWLLELMAEVDKLVGSDDEDWLWDDSDEEDEEESDEEEEDVEEEGEKEEVTRNHEEKSKATEECGKLCIATVFEEGKVEGPILPIKCEDPKVWGVNIMDCLCDPGACRSVMPYELYALLDLGPLKKTKEVFIMADLGIVSIEGIAEDVLVKIGNLTLENVEEIFHPVRPPASSKKNAHQVQLDNDGKVGNKKREESRRQTEKGKGSRHTPPQTKKKKKDPMKHTPKKRNREKGSSKEKIEEEKARRKIELKCASVDDLIDKLKAFKGSLHNNQEFNTHLVQDHSKWK
ncbi:hypothetical protein PIB30_091856 [Stylosanthes scabra]|uniref:Uncharacterized protein n=1 Tax=Stylosanthes scabra TaxID=79078 RepID=A0ABU6YSF8_9FABA|nr:hypothetical protein [Stylosanthes scabra]